MKVVLDLIRNTKEKISDWFKFAGKVQLRRGHSEAPPHRER